TELLKKDLGWLWNWLPKGAVRHDPNAYLKSTTQGEVCPKAETAKKTSEQPASGFIRNEAEPAKPG
ncbi:MAG: hypothetical protein ABIG11_04830, partial [bacterium]